MSINRASALPPDDSRAGAAKAALAAVGKTRRLSGVLVLAALPDAFIDAFIDAFTDTLASALALRTLLLALSAYTDGAASVTQVSEISKEITARFMRTDMEIGKLKIKQHAG